MTRIDPAGECIVNEVEHAYCVRCKSVQRCRVTTDGTVYLWYCLACGACCDEQFVDMGDDDEQN